MSTQPDRHSLREASDESLRKEQCQLLLDAANTARGAARTDLLLEPERHSSTPIKALASAALKLWKDSGDPAEGSEILPGAKSWKRYEDVVAKAMTETENRDCSVPRSPVDAALSNVVGHILGRRDGQRLSAIFSERSQRRQRRSRQSKKKATRGYRSYEGRSSDYRIDQRDALDSLLVEPVRSVEQVLGYLEGFDQVSRVTNGSIPPYVSRPKVDSALLDRLVSAVESTADSGPWARVCIADGTRRSGSTRCLLEALRALAIRQPDILGAEMLQARHNKLGELLDLLASGVTGRDRTQWYLVFVEQIGGALWPLNSQVDAVPVSDIASACWGELNVLVVGTSVEARTALVAVSDRDAKDMANVALVDVPSVLSSAEQAEAQKHFGPFVSVQDLSALPNALKSQDELVGRIDAGHSRHGSRQQAILRALVEASLTHPAGVDMRRLETLYTHWWRRERTGRLTPLDFKEAIDWATGESRDGIQIHPSLIIETNSGFRIEDKIRPYARTLVTPDSIWRFGYVASEPPKSIHQTTAGLLQTLDSSVKQRISSQLDAIQTRSVELQLRAVNTVLVEVPVPTLDASELFEFWKTNPRVVLLGEAGAGKTVCCLRGALKQLSSAEKQSELAEVLPLADWFAWHRTHPSLSINSWIAHWLTANYRIRGSDGRDALTKEAARRILNGGHLWLMFDGLDEIPSHAARQKVIDEIVHLGHEVGLRYIVTSRPNEFNTLDVEATSFDQTLLIDRLGASEIENVIRQSVQPARNGGWSAIVAELPTNKSLKELLARPLYLAIALSSYPDSRSSPDELLGQDRQAAEQQIWQRFLGSSSEAVQLGSTHELSWLAETTSDRHSFGLHELSYFTPRRAERLQNWRKEGPVLLAAVIGALCAATTWLAASQVGGKVILGAISLGAGLITGFAGLLVGSWAIARSGDHIRAWSPRPTIRERVAGGVDGLVFGLILAISIKVVAAMSLPVGGLVALIAREVPSAARLMVLTGVLVTVGAMLGSPQASALTEPDSTKSSWRVPVSAGLCLGMLFDGLYLVVSSRFATADIPVVVYPVVPVALAALLLTLDIVMRSANIGLNRLNRNPEAEDDLFVGSRPLGPFRRSLVVGAGYGIAYAAAAGSTALVLSANSDASPAMRIGLACVYAITAGVGAATINGVGPVLYAWLLGHELQRHRLLPKRPLRALAHHASKPATQTAILRRAGSLFSFRHRELSEYLAAGRQHSAAESPTAPTRTRVLRLAAIVGVGSLAFFVAATVSELSRGPTTLRSASLSEDSAGITVIDLSARCLANDPNETLRCGNLVAAANELNERLAKDSATWRVKLEAIYDNISSASYRRELDTVHYDIIHIHSTEIARRAENATIRDINVLLEACRQTDGCDVDLRELPVQSSNPDVGVYTDQNHRWSIKQDVDLQPLYYRRDLILELGIEPDEFDRKVRTGSLDFEDLMDVANEAIRRGLVEPGNGWWHRPKEGTFFYNLYLAAGGQVLDEQTGRLTMDEAAVSAVYRNLSHAIDRQVLVEDRLDGDWQSWNTMVANGKVLFWSGGTWQWGDWANNFVADRSIGLPFINGNAMSGHAYLETNVGATLFPTMSSGRGTTISTSTAYAISSSTNDNVALAALQVIALATSERRLEEHSLKSGNLSPFQKANKAIHNACDLTGTSSLQRCHQSRMSELISGSIELPNDLEYELWADTFYCGLKAVEAGGDPTELAKSTVESYAASDPWCS